jgi:hypothetical protein
LRCWLLLDFGDICYALGKKDLKCLHGIFLKSTPKLETPCEQWQSKVDHEEMCGEAYFLTALSIPLNHVLLPSTYPPVICSSSAVNQRFSTSMAWTPVSILVLLKKKHNFFNFQAKTNHHFLFKQMFFNTWKVTPPTIIPSWIYSCRAKFYLKSLQSEQPRTARTTANIWIPDQVDWTGLLSLPVFQWSGNQIVDGSNACFHFSDGPKLDHFIKRKYFLYNKHFRLVVPF